MWRHFPHHTHARCGETSDFSTSFMGKNFKLLHIWKNFRFLHICHVEKFEITPHVEKFHIALQLSCREIWDLSTWWIFLHRHRLPPVIPVTNMRYGRAGCIWQDTYLLYRKRRNISFQYQQQAMCLSPFCQSQKFIFVCTFGAEHLYCTVWLSFVMLLYCWDRSDPRIFLTILASIPA